MDIKPTDSINTLDKAFDQAITNIHTDFKNSQLADRFKKTVHFEKNQLHIANFTTNMPKKEQSHVNKQTPKPGENSKSPPIPPSFATKDSASISAHLNKATPVVPNKTIEVLSAKVKQLELGMNELKTHSLSMQADMESLKKEYADLFVQYTALRSEVGTRRQNEESARDVSRNRVVTKPTKVTVVKKL